ncbi:MAG: restriction endonuclease [Defluviitaleaceae bacterium]|nr:restriction endonuclease [Defluviitaleaceae bacterium]
MLKYEDLKKSKDGMPTIGSLYPVIMTLLLQKDNFNRKELRSKVADLLNLPSELSNAVYKSGNGNIFENRIDWALSELKVAGLISLPMRSVFSITDLGKQLFDKHKEKFDEKIVKAQPKYIAHQAVLKERRKSSDYSNLPQHFQMEDEQENPIEILDTTERNHKDDIATQLLERIRNESPKFFENLVVELLVAMGYKGAGGLAKSTGAPGDGGIDGEISQDPLGINKIFMQAKRYNNDNKISKQEILAFSSALKLKGADRGVFITTSSFTKDAKEVADTLLITTIDGIKLTDLMLDYKVGVQIDRTFYLYKIDEDFFDMI